MLHGLARWLQAVRVFAAGVRGRIVALPLVLTYCSEDRKPTHNAVLLDGRTKGKKTRA